MAGLTNLISSALAAQAGAIGGVVGAAPGPVNSIPDTPYVYLSPPRGRQIPGSWESRLYTFTMHYLIARVSGDEAVDQAVINDACDAVLNAFRSGITLGSLATVSVAQILAFDTDKFYTVGAEEYAAVDFEVGVEVYQAASYTP